MCLFRNGLPSSWLVAVHGKVQKGVFILSLNAETLQPNDPFPRIGKSCDNQFYLGYKSWRVSKLTLEALALMMGGS